MSKVSMTGMFKCQEDKGDEMEAAVAAQIDALADDSNAEIYTYSRGEDDQWTFFAVFPSQEAMQNHGQSDAAQEAAETFHGLLAGPPHVVVADTVTAKGFSA